MQKRKLLSVLIGQAFAVGAMGAATAYAQENQSVERVTVTGSSIKRIAAEGALPVQVISREEINRTGATSTTELMQQLPALQGFTTSADSVGGGGGGFMGASLHDIGEEYTLVLLNGKRMAPRGSGSAVDLNSIPLSAIERVEVLTDGASAIYGSDAIAGVVNFILKQNQQGVEASARLTSPQHSGGKGWNADLSAGFGNLDTDGFNVLVAVSHDHQDRLAAADRDFAKSGIISFKAEGQDLYFFNGSGNAIPGNAKISYVNAAGQTKAYSFNPYLKKTGSCAASNSQIGNNCYFDYTSTIEIQPQSDRDSFFGRGTLRINSDWTASFDAAWSKYKMTTRIAPYPTGFVPLPTDSALVAEWILPYLTAEQRAGLTGVQGQWRALAAGNRTTDWTTESTHLVAGLEGALAGWDVSGAVTYSINDTKQDYPTGWLLADPFVSAVSAGSVNIFAPASELTDADRAAVAPAIYHGPWDQEKTTLTGIEGRASRPIFKLAGGDAQIGTGIDYRSYKYSRSVSEANTNELLLFLGKDDPYELERSVYGVFGELALPLMKGLEVTGAVRYDNIGKVRNNATGVDLNDSANDTTYKLSARYQPITSILVRGSIGTGFKAPSMLEIGRPRSEFGVTGDNYACPFPAGDPLAAYCQPEKAQYNIYKQGYAGLKPEKSDQQTLGIVLQATADLSASLDYWRVKMKDQVSELSEAQIFNNAERYRDLFTYKLNNATGERELAIIQTAVNIGQSEYSGLDWNLNWKTATPIGKLTANLSGTYMLDSQYTRPGTSDDWTDSLGKYGENNAVTFRNIIKASVNLAHGAFSHTMTAKFRSGYRDQLKTADECAVSIGDALGDCYEIALQIPAYTLYDWQTVYTVNKNASVTFGINNLFDKTPPLSLQTGAGSHQVGYDPRYTDAFGRTFYLATNLKF
jgi:iron complex outermembrane recepter protein